MQNHLSEKNVVSVATKTKEGRFLFVDALRGFAAVLVLLYHLLGDPAVGKTILDTFHLGGVSVLLSYGVEIFFVLSGFVIAHSLRRTVINRQEIWSFIVRRQVRLDPAYWAVLLLTLVWWHYDFSRLQISPPPTLRDTIINMAYLHGILHAQFVLGVSWTLCLEVQFYLFFILLLWCATRSNRQFPVQPHAIAFLVALTGLGSLVLMLIRPPSAFGFAKFFHLWFFFAWGALVYWTTQRAISSTYVKSAAVIMASAVFVAPFLTPVGRGTSLPLVVGLLAGGVLWLAGKRNALSSWGAHPFWQHLGRISYSLYLTHTLTATVVLFLLRRSQPSSLPVSIFLLVSLVGVCWIAAFVFYCCIEEPSLKWSKKIRRVFTFSHSFASREESNLSRSSQIP